jgi:hypothetical protein
MTKKERMLTAALLEMAADEFGNHGCNDMDRKLLDKIGFTEEEKIALGRQYHEYNGDPEEAFGTVKDFDWIHDYAWMGFMAHKLLREDEPKVDSIGE